MDKDYYEEPAFRAINFPSDFIDEKYTHKIESYPNMTVVVQSFSYARDPGVYAATISQEVCKHFEGLGYSVWYPGMGQFGGDGTGIWSVISQFIFEHKDLIKVVLKIPAIVSLFRKLYNAMQTFMVNRATRVMTSSKNDAKVWLTLTLPGLQEYETDKADQATWSAKEILLALPQLNAVLEERFPELRYSYRLMVRDASSQRYISVDLPTTKAVAISKLLKAISKKMPELNKERSFRITIRKILPVKISENP